MQILMKPSSALPVPKKRRVDSEAPPTSARESSTRNSVAVNQPPRQRPAGPSAPAGTSSSNAIVHSRSVPARSNALPAKSKVPPLTNRSQQPAPQRAATAPQATSRPGLIPLKTTVGQTIPRTQSRPQTMSNPKSAVARVATPTSSTHQLLSTPRPIRQRAANPAALKVPGAVSANAKARPLSAPGKVPASRGKVSVPGIPMTSRPMMAARPKSAVQPAAKRPPVVLPNRVGGNVRPTQASVYASRAASSRILAAATRGVRGGYMPMFRASVMRGRGVPGGMPGMFLGRAQGMRRGIPGRGGAAAMARYDPYGLDEMTEEDMEFIDDDEAIDDDESWRRDLRAITNYDPSTYDSVEEAAESDNYKVAMEERISEAHGRREDLEEYRKQLAMRGQGDEDEEEEEDDYDEE